MHTPSGDCDGGGGRAATGTATAAASPPPAVAALAELSAADSVLLPSPASP